MKLDEFTTAYIDCMLWSTMDDSDDSGGEPLGKNHGIDDIDDDGLRDIIADCTAFQKEHISDIEGHYQLSIKRNADQWSDTQMAGYDFWLTRNGHGAGFWDGDWEEEAGQYMTETSEKMGEVFTYVGDNGKIYLSS